MKENLVPKERKKRATNLPGSSRKQSCYGALGMHPTGALGQNWSSPVPIPCRSTSKFSETRNAAALTLSYSNVVHG